MSEQKSSGCKGCLIWLLSAFVLVLLLAGIAFYLGYRKLQSFRDQYTQASPLVLPASHYSQAEVDAVQKRVDDFFGRSQTNRLALSANDLNAMLASSALSNRVYVTLTNKSFAGQITVPVESFAGFLNRFGVTVLRGRYLNGVVLFEVGSEQGKPTVRLMEITVNGHPLPEHYMKQIHEVDYAAGLHANLGPGQQGSRTIERVAVENDHLIFEVGGTNQSQ